jgi:phospholipid/cholesterol/gamma-HCH transport system substrate-binding protein
MRSRMWLAVVAIAGALVLSSCAFLNVDAIPVPGTSYTGGHDITIEFASVLNLPERAKVVMDGAKVGVVKHVALTARGVEVTARIDHDVEVPSTIYAVMQQATVLGDTYIALERAPDAASTRPLGPGGRIPLAQTTSPPQLEDTIANMANFIGSGSIQRAQNSVIKINAITPPRPEIRQMASRAAADLSDLSNNIDTVDTWLSGLSESGKVMSVNTKNFEYWLSPPGVLALRHNMVPLHYRAVATDARHGLLRRILVSPAPDRDHGCSGSGPALEMGV